MSEKNNNFKYTLRDKELENTSKSLYQILYDSAMQHKDVIALELGETRITYGRLVDEIDKAAVMFLNIGITEKDVVAIVHNGLPATIISIYALSKIGAKMSLITSTGVKLRFVEIAIKSNCSYALMSCKEYNRLYEAVESTPIKNVIISQFKDYFDSLELHKTYMVKARKADKLRYPKNRASNVKVHLWDKLLKDVPDNYQSINIEMNRSIYDTAIYNHFGSAKCDLGTVEISEAAVNREMKKLSIFLSGSNNGEQYRVLSLVDKAYTYGLVFGIHTPLVMGHTLLMCNANATDIPVNDINYYKPDVLIAYPSIINKILDNSDINEETEISIKKVFSGGDLFSGILQSKFQTTFDEVDKEVELYQFYGVTETLSVVACNTPELTNDRSIGTALPGVKVMICDPQTMREMPVGQTGEIFVLTDSCVNGYLEDAKASDRLIRNHPDGRKWIMTGDMGHCDENGLLYFDGSSKRCEEIDGMQVFPQAVEDEIKNLYGVEECAVVVATDNNNFKELVAVIVPKEELLFDNDRLSVLKESIMMDCQTMFTGAMVPHDVEFRAYLPKLTNNKIDIPTLTLSVNENRNK